jgi:hypothetical protein
MNHCFALPVFYEPHQPLLQDVASLDSAHLPVSPQLNHSASQVRQLCPHFEHKQIWDTNHWAVYLLTHAGTYLFQHSSSSVSRLHCRCIERTHVFFLTSVLAIKADMCVHRILRIPIWSLVIRKRHRPGCLCPQRRSKGSNCSSSAPLSSSFLLGR